MPVRFGALPAAFAVAIVAVLCPGYAQARPWTLADIEATRTVAAVRIAPAGDRLAYAVSWVDPQSHRDRFTWYVRSVAGPGDVALDLGAGADVYDLSWSRAGDAIAWTADGRLWRRDLAAKSTRALTGGTRPVLAFTWSPDGTRIAAVEAAPPSSGAKAPSYWLDPLAAGVATTVPAALELWIVDATSGAERRIPADGSFGGEAAASTPTWLPDGKHVAIGRQPTAYYADYERLHYVVVDVQTGASTPVGGAYSTLPGSSRPAVDDAGNLAYVHTSDGTTSGRTDVYAGDRDVSAPLDRDFWSCANTRLASNGQALFASALDGAAMRVFRLDGEPRAITPAGRSVLGFLLSRNGRIAYVESAPDLLPEVVVADADGSHPVRLTHASSIPAGVDVAPTRLVRTATHDGHELVAQLTEPRGTHAPLIVELHGGPQCSDDISFSPTAQWFSTNGYAFLRPNPRGSDGYGAWSYKAIVGDFGDGPLDDVRATIASALAGGAIDPQRMFVEGGSYGGYLTSWAVTHDDRFRAAVAAFPLVDLLPLFSALSRSPGIARRFFGSAPLATPAARDLMRAQSPSAHTDALHTPLLLMAGLHDAQAPYPQAIAFYRTLYESGKDVRMLVFPDAGHGPSDTAGNDDVLAHIAGWFAAHGGLSVPGAIGPPGP